MVKVMDTEGTAIVLVVGLLLPLLLALVTRRLWGTLDGMRRVWAHGPAPEDLPTREEVEQIALAIRLNAGTRSRQHLPDNSQCALCLDEYSSPVEFLPCCHTFCNSCALSLWSHSGRHRRICCPCCRTPTEHIFPAYALRDAAAHHQRGGGGRDVGRQEESIRCDRQLHAYNVNATFAARSSIRTSLLVLSRGLANARLLPALVQIKIGAAFLLMAVYLVLPVDLVPDVLGLIGFIDDVAVALIMAAIAARVLLSVLA